MSDIKSFLKVLAKFDYPNPSIQSLASLSGYALDNFLPDLVDEIGSKKANEFVKKTIKKLSGKDGIKVTGDNDEYAYIKLHNPYIDLDNDETSVSCDWSWGKTHLLHTDEDGKKSYKTIEELEDDLGMGEWSEFEDYIDSIKEDCNIFVGNNCGFYIWWEDYRPKNKKGDRSLP